MNNEKLSFPYHQETFIESNLGIVDSYANIFEGEGLEREDLLQEGYIALLKSAANFDISKNIPFYNYANIVVRNSLVNALADQSGPITLPHNVFSEYCQIRKSLKSLSQRFQDTPTTEEIAADTGLPTKKVETLINITQPPLPLSVPLVARNSKRHIFLDDIIPDSSNKSPEKAAIVTCIKEEIDKFLNQIPEEESSILRQHYGLDGNPPKTIAEIAKTLGVSKSYINLLAKHGRERLKTKPGIKEFMEFFDRPE